MILCHMILYNMIYYNLSISDIWLPAGKNSVMQQQLASLGQACRERQRVITCPACRSG